MLKFQFQLSKFAWFLTKLFNNCTSGFATEQAECNTADKIIQIYLVPS